MMMATDEQREMWDTPLFFDGKQWHAHRIQTFSYEKCPDGYEIILFNSGEKSRRLALCSYEEDAKIITEMIILACKESNNGNG